MIDAIENLLGYDEQLLGDLNQDSLINILDVILMINIILNNDDFNDLADMNIDGVINVLDIVNLVNIILN